MNQDNPLFGLLKKSVVGYKDDKTGNLVTGTLTTANIDEIQKMVVERSAELLKKSVDEDNAKAANKGILHDIERVASFFPSVEDRLDEEEEETLVADQTDETFLVSANDDGSIGLFNQFGSGDVYTEDQIAVLMDKLSWALSAVHSRKDRVPF